MISKNIIGSGFIAKNFLKIDKFIKKSNYLIYCAGISNSKIFSKFELKRELKTFNKFTERNYKRKLIYISTADIKNNLKKKDLYIKNKILIEKIIKKKFKEYIIIRLPQIIGYSNNKNTLINYFYNNIKKNKKIIINVGVKRNILDIEDVTKVLKLILSDNNSYNRVVTLSNKYSVNPIEIVNIFEKKLNKKAKITFVKTNKQKWLIKNTNSLKLFNKAKVRFDKDYLLKKINKYY